MSKFNLGFIPHLIQKMFLSCPADEILYGGALGGGKSAVAVVKALQLACKYPGIHVGLFRNTVQELRMTLLQEIYKWYPSQLYKYKDQIRTVYLPNGSMITLNYIENDKDLHNYEGIEFDVIIADECVRLTEYQISWLKSTRLRTARKDGFRTRFIGLTNPIGVSRRYLYKRFVENKVPFMMYKTPETENIPDEGIVIEGVLIKPRYSVYIPARLTDNLALMQNDPTYISRLKELHPDDFLALLLGIWENRSGLFFSEWEDSSHIIEGYVPTNKDRLYTAIDWGSAKPTAIGFFAVKPDQTCVMYDEIYTMKNGQHDVGTNENAVQVCDRYIARVLAYHAITGLMPKVLIMDSQCWAKDGTVGFSISEIFQRKLSQYGIMVIQARKDRISGWQTVREFLGINKVTSAPYLQVTKSCENFIRTFPELMHSQVVDGDVNTIMEDHAGDMIRYFFMAIPKPTTMIKKMAIPKGSEAYYDMHRVT